MKALKTHYLFLFVALVILNSCKKESIDNSVYNGNISLYSQNDINNFKEKGYKTINGDLEIIDLYDDNYITDLSGLADIREINGLFMVYGCRKLYSLKGIEGIEHVNRLSLYNNDLLTDVEALSNIRITESIYMQFNSALKDIPLLKGINELSGEVLLEFNEKMKTLSFLGNLTKISNYLYLSKLGIKDMTGLNKLKSIGTRFNLYGIDSLKTFEGLGNLETVGAFLLQGCFYMHDFNGLKSLKSISGYLQLADGDSVKTLAPLMNIKQCRTLYVSGMPSITSLFGLDSLRVDSAFIISTNRKLTDFCALKPVLKKSPSSIVFTCKENSTNPTIQDIMNCQ